MKYDKCPKCELNYKNVDDELCPLCSKGCCVTDEVELDCDICPYCDKHKLEYGEEMCSHCAKLRQKTFDNDM